jgi:hypothetical protein
MASKSQQTRINLLMVVGLLSFTAQGQDQYLNIDKIS